MADKRDYYEVLGVERGCSVDELKKEITMRSWVSARLPVIQN